MSLTLDIQRVRNLTTGRLHTKIGHVYEDLDAIIGEDGLMTHMLPRVIDAVRPWLQSNLDDSRFWDGAYDVTHVGTVTLREPTAQERKAMFDRFKAMPNPLAGKDVIVVALGDEGGAE